MTFIKNLEETKKKIKAGKKGLTITISGPSGSGKSTTAKALAERLGLKNVSAGRIMRDIAEERGMTMTELCSVAGEDVDRKMDKATLKLAAEGGVVLDGRLTGWVAGDTADVRIYMDCPLEKRSKRISGRGDPENGKAAEKRDAEDARRYKEYYGIDVNNKSIYHIVIDSGKFTEKEMVEEILRRTKEILGNHALHPQDEHKSL